MMNIASEILLDNGLLVKASKVNIRLERVTNAEWSAPYRKLFHLRVSVFWPSRKLDVL